MIHATKAHVDQAETDLADRLEDLAHAICDWLAHPSSTTQQKTARKALDDADEAYATYEQTLTTWAAGPGAGEM